MLSIGFAQIRGTLAGDVCGQLLLKGTPNGIGPLSRWVGIPWAVLSRALDFGHSENMSSTDLEC